VRVALPGTGDLSNYILDTQPSIKSPTILPTKLMFSPVWPQWDV